MLGIIATLTPHLGHVARTVPHAYDDPKLDEEYARLMFPEVEASRDADIDQLRDSLQSGGDRRDLDDAQALSWTRALNHLRLVAGGLLGVEEGGWGHGVDQAVLEGAAVTMVMAPGV